MSVLTGTATAPSFVADHEDALLHLQAQDGKRVGAAVDRGGQLGVGDRTARKSEGGARAAPLGDVTIDEEGRGVEMLGNGCHRANFTVRARRVSIMISFLHFFTDRLSP
jgi:hypothetical protein